MTRTNRALASAALWIVASCAQPARETHRIPPWKSTTTRSAPSSFLDIPGLSEVMVSTHTDDEWGDSDTTRIEVLRAGKVVCDLPDGARESHENHSSSSHDQLVPSSRDPLRFHVRELSISNELGPSERCTGFELRAGETCRQLFDHSCSEAACKLTYTTSLAPGAGTLRGKVSRDNEPVVGGSVLIGSQLAISDEHGGFSIEAGPGVHEIAIASSLHAYAQKASVLIGPDQDAEVSIAITCPCCAP